MPKVFISGCFDMLHSGHIAFIEEAAAMGDLYVGVARDDTIALLKGREPTNNERERLYMIKALRAVKDAWICSGVGMLEFVDDIKKLKPDVFFVNSDGSSVEKEKLCKELGIRYEIGKRVPRDGLPIRSTTSYREECRIPYRMDIAGAWLDQPTLSKLAGGPVVTASIEPDVELADLAGMATSTRKKAIELWGTQVPANALVKSAKALFCYENPPGSSVISGSQDSLGICLPGLNRLEYGGGFWPDSITSCHDDAVLSWLERHVFLVFINQRASDYNPYAQADIAADKIRELAACSRQCWDAAVAMDYDAFASSFLGSFEAQARILPAIVTPAVKETIAAYAPRVSAWMLQGAGGGGYMAVVAKEMSERMIRIRIRRKLF